MAVSAAHIGADAGVAYTGANLLSVYSSRTQIDSSRTSESLADMAQGPATTERTEGAGSVADFQLVVGRIVQHQGHTWDLEDMLVAQLRLNVTWVEIANETAADCCDLLVCVMPASRCLEFRSGSTPMVLHFHNRLGREVARYGDASIKDPSFPTKVVAAVAQLREALGSARNLIFVDNVFDHAFMRYTAGVTVSLGTTLCGHAAREATYAPVEQRFVIGPHRMCYAHYGLIRELFAANARRDEPLLFEVIRLSVELSNYKLGRLAQFMGAVMLPINVNTIIFKELYSMAVPLFYPHPRLLAAWEVAHSLMLELFPQTRLNDYSLLDGGVSASHDPPSVLAAMLHSPFNRSVEALSSWFALSEFVTTPHVHLFTSWSHLLHLLQSTDLFAASAAMAAHNRQRRSDATGQWSTFILRSVIGAAHERHRRSAGGADAEEIRVT